MFQVQIVSVFRSAFLVLLSLTMMTAAAAAQSVTIGWNANPESNLSGYTLQYGTQSGSPSSTLDVGRVTSRQVTGLQSGATYYFRVRAYNTSGQTSAPSTEVSYRVPGTTTTTAPAIGGVSPTSGPTSGGTQLTITGTGFISGAAVTVGGRSATTVFVSATQLRATTPTGTGLVAVRVTNPGGLSATRSNAFTYIATTAAPAIGAVSPTSGPLSGGTLITITGTSFVSGARVNVGGRAATTTFVNSTQVRATTPTGAAAGATSVQVVNPNGQAATRGNAFTYLGSSSGASPNISSLTPTSGRLSGGTLVTITGTNFASGASVRFGGRAATTAFISSTQVRATTPSGAAIGPVAVQLINPNGLTATRGNGFTYTSNTTSATATSAASTLMSTTDDSGVATVDSSSTARTAASSAATLTSTTEGSSTAGAAAVAEGELAAPAEAVDDVTALAAANAPAVDASPSPATVRRYLPPTVAVEGERGFLAIANANRESAMAVLSFIDAAGEVKELPVTIAGRQRVMVPLPVRSAGAEQDAVRLDADRPVDLERIVVSDGGRAGATRTVAVDPSMRWYFADGSTSAPFDLHYVIYNPGPDAVSVDVRYLRPAGADPIVVRHTVAGYGRETIRVADEDAMLADTNLAAEVVSVDGVAVVVERKQLVADDRSSR